MVLDEIMCHLWRRVQWENHDGAAGCLEEVGGGGEEKRWETSQM